ncbi:MAG: hypothetical protein JJU00_18050, partial [Opitutales bacterium]|nr:hypothetical protein [Opitutales bacterium]
GGLGAGAEGGWARAGIGGMLGTAAREGEESEKEATKFLESYGLLLRVKDDTGGDSGESALDLLERIPGLLRGAAVGTRDFVAGVLGVIGRKRLRGPVVCRSADGGGEALCHAVRPRL